MKATGDLVSEICDVKVGNVFFGTPDICYLKMRQSIFHESANILGIVFLLPDIQRRRLGFGRFVETPYNILSRNMFYYRPSSELMAVGVK